MCLLSILLAQPLTRRQLPKAAPEKYPSSASAAARPARPPQSVACPPAGQLFLWRDEKKARRERGEAARRKGLLEKLPGSLEDRSGKWKSLRLGLSQSAFPRRCVFGKLEKNIASFLCATLVAAAALAAVTARAPITTSALI